VKRKPIEAYAAKTTRHAIVPENEIESHISSDQANSFMLSF
jgi:hypothetical protein